MAARDLLSLSVPVSLTVQETVLSVPADRGVAALGTMSTSIASNCKSISTIKGEACNIGCSVSFSDLALDADIIGTSPYLVCRGESCPPLNRRLAPMFPTLRATFIPLHFGTTSLLGNLWPPPQWLGGHRGPFWNPWGFLQDSRSYLRCSCSVSSERHGAPTRQALCS